MLQPYLPPDFELVHYFNISYCVHMKYTTDDGVEVVSTVNVLGDRNYLNLDMLDTCIRQEFAVKAVINNELHSMNSSVVNDPDGML